MYTFFMVNILKIVGSHLFEHIGPKVFRYKQYNLEGMWETGKANEGGYFINNLEHDWFQNAYTNGAYHIEGAPIG